MVMGYQSHWIWFDYLQRLLEMWELEQGRAGGWFDSRLEWPEELGARPPTPILPEPVAELYHAIKDEKMSQLARLRDPAGGEELRADWDYFRERKLSAREADKHAREAVARRYARYETARSWARHPDGWKRIRSAYSLLERFVGRELFWQFDAVDMDYITGDPEAALKIVAREFPAVNMFLPKGDLAERIRGVVRKQGAEWGEPIYTQYIAYAQNERDGLFWGNAHGGEGTATFRNGWYQAIGRNLESGEELTSGEAGRSSLIQYTTWNDYAEHTHLAPSLQLRYALTELARYFIHYWKEGASSDDARNEAFLFYRKYPESKAALTFPFLHAPNYHPGKFEVVTTLEHGGRVDLLAPEDSGLPALRAESRSVDAGFSVLSYEGADINSLWLEGKVAARVGTSSDKLMVIGWEEVTHRPFRQDYTLVGASSRCDELWREDMPDSSMGAFFFSEYGDDDEDGMPNWFEMLYLAHGWLDVESRTGADASGDANRDGITNLEHYLRRTNPVFFEAPLPYSMDRRGRPTPSIVDPRRVTRIQAERFDHGGPGVAYGRYHHETMTAGSYRMAGYDMASHREVESHEKDAGDWMMGPLGDGDWMVYALQIPAGCYRLRVRVREGGGRFMVALNGDLAIAAPIESSGLWSTQELGSFEVTRSGVYSLRVKFESPGYALNWFELVPCRVR